MIAQVKVDISGALAQLQRCRQDQIPYATSRALNDCADAAVNDLVAWVQSVFNFRGQTGWIRRAWFESKWSNKNQNPITAYVIGKLDYLLLHERGGIKTPHAGPTLAVPLGNLKLKRIPSSLRPRYLLGKDLGALLRSASLKGSRSRKKQIANFGGGFILTLNSKRFIALRTSQDIGLVPSSRRFAGLRLLYVLVPSVRIVPRLRIRQTIESSVRTHFNDAFAKRMAEAMRSAR